MNDARDHPQVVDAAEGGFLAGNASRFRRLQVWAMDFVSDALWTGRRFRSLVIVDAFSKKSPAILPEFSTSSARIARLLDELAVRHGLPEAIVSDNGPEFTSKAIFLWAQRTGVTLRFIDPGKPIQNAFAESLIGKFRDECLNENWFGGLPETQRIIETWRIHYNERRPHSRLGNLAPAIYAKLNAPAMQRDGTLRSPADFAPRPVASLGQAGSNEVRILLTTG